MFERLHADKRVQLVLGLVFGITFGFLLQKGGVTQYDVIIGQLLLTDFTVVKIMLAAVVTGMLGVYAMKSLGWAQLHTKGGSVGSTVIGGLIFGAGFAVLGYCPGTLAGAVGQGALDALFGGVTGLLIGAGLFAAFYPRLNRGILQWGAFETKTIPELLRVNPWFVVIPVMALILALLWLLEYLGL
jgi:hypothetical protein